MTSVHGAAAGRVRWGMMLSLAAVGGFFIPIIFGHLVAHTSFDTGWVFLALVSAAFALLGLAGRNPAPGR
jgi:MFS transporter, ACS family, D-galactonate transporter